ncbi:hypothetical protein ABMA27_008927 [Loxostege sticticalis]|uniref:Glucose-methanol-choline oxidoreductase N-terminal domain-containing protein n=1 Tax=Loxostege sticticalis TaxID=481309 RepID=A0ABR3H9A0_LOXSC
MDLATGISTIQAFQSSLSVLTALQLTAYKYPPPASFDENLNFDYVVVGAGTAGAVLAARLSENPDITVALIEAGGDPPLEAEYAGLFPLEIKMEYDYNFLGENDNFSCQHAQRKVPQMTSGKLLGGTTGVMHLNYFRGDPQDYNRWAEISGDDSWKYDNLFPYFVKMERMEDPEILNSETANLHGTEGPLRITREPNAMNKPYINSFEEIGLGYNLDTNNNKTLGVTDSFLMISSDGTRQDTAECYLSPARDRKNLYVYKQTVVTKIIFDDDKNAIGVEAFTPDNQTVTIKVKREVIVSAGAIKSPQILMLSGIGPQDHLKELDISVISDLPVGQNLRDRPGVALVYKMQASNETVPPADPRMFPVPHTFSFKAMDESQNVPDFQAVNLVFPHDQLGLTMISAFVVKYEDAISTKFIEANTGHELLMSILSNGYPKSTGQVLLKSTNPLEDPEIHLGLFSNSSDVEDMGEYLKYYSQIGETTYFKDVGAEFVKLNLPECEDLEFGSLDYWKCYAVGMSVPFWQSMSTCSMGSVVDSELKVKGVQNLRVVDASAVPYFTSGKPIAAIMVMAEKVADLIKQSQ